MEFLEKQLAQARENSTDAVSVYSPPSKVTVIIEEIWLCNTTNAAVTYDLFCDDDGTTYSEATALAWQQTIEAYGNYRIPCRVMMSDENGNFAYKSSVANALTITLFGKFKFRTTNFRHN